MQSNIFNILVDRAQVTDVTVTYESQEINWLNNTWKDWNYDDYYQYAVGSYGWENTNFSPLYVQSFTGLNTNGNFTSSSQYIHSSPATFALLNPFNGVTVNENSPDSYYVDVDEDSVSMSEFIRFDGWESRMYSIPNGGTAQGTGLITMPNGQVAFYQVNQNIAYGWNNRVDTFPYVTAALFGTQTTQNPFVPERYGHPGLLYFRTQSNGGFNSERGWYQHEDNFSEYITGVTWNPDPSNPNQSDLTIKNNNYPIPNSSYFFSISGSNTALYCINEFWQRVGEWKAYNFYNDNLDGGGNLVSQRRFYIKVETSTGSDNAFITNTGRSWHYNNVDSLLDLFNHQHPVTFGYGGGSAYFWEDIHVDDARTGETLIGYAPNPNYFPSYPIFNPTIVEVGKRKFGIFTELSTSEEKRYATITIGLNFYKYLENGQQWSPTELSPYTIAPSMSQVTFTNTYAGGGAELGYSKFEPMSFEYFNGEYTSTQSTAAMSVFGLQSGGQYLRVTPPNGISQYNNRMVIRMKIDVLFGVQYHMYLQFQVNMGGVGGKIYFTQSKNLDWQQAIADRGTQWVKFGGVQGQYENILFDFIAENHTTNHGNGYIIIVWDDGASGSHILEMSIKENGLGWRQGVGMAHYLELKEGSQSSAFFRHGNQGEATIGRLSDHPLVITTSMPKTGTIKENWWTHSSTTNQIPGLGFGGTMQTSYHTDYNQDEGYGTSLSEGANNYLADKTEWCDMYNDPESLYDGTPNDHTIFLYPHTFQPKDNKGFFLNKHKDFTFRIEITGPKLFMFADNRQSKTYSTKSYKNLFCSQTGSIQMHDYDSPAGAGQGWNLLQKCRQENGIENSSNFKLGYIKFHTCEYSYITKDPQGNDKAKIYFDPTRTETDKPVFFKKLPPNEEEGWTNFTVDVEYVDYASTAAQSANSKDHLLVEGLDSNQDVIWTITCNNTTQQSYTQSVNIGQTIAIQITPSGTTGYGLDALINSVGFATNEATLSVFQEPTLTTNDCHVYATGNGVIDSTWTVTTADGATSSAGLPNIMAALDLLLYNSDPAANMIPVVLAAQVVTIYVDVVSIHSDTKLTITDYLTGTALHYTITSAGLTEIDRNIPSNLYGVGGIILSFSHHSASTTMDCVVSKVWIEAKNPTTYFGYSATQFAIDLFKDTEPFALNLNSKNYEVLDSLNGDYTKTVKVPATKNNLKAFDSQDQITAVYSDQFFQGIGAQAYVDGLEVFRGSAFLDSVQYDEYGEQSLDLLFKGGNSNWAQLLDSNRAHLRNLFVNDNQDGTQLTPSSITLANSSNASHVVFPLVDVGRWHDTNQGEFDSNEEILAITLDHLRPSYKINRVMDKAFESIGWSFESEVLKENSEFAGFGPDFQNQYLQLIGTPPEAKVHEDAINNSLILLETAQTHKTRSNPMFGDTAHMRMIRFPSGPDSSSWVTQRALAFETEHRDDAAQHVVRNVAASEIVNWGSSGGQFQFGDLDGQNSGYATNFFNDITQGAGSVGQKSFITVNTSGYYRITANMIINMYMPQAPGAGLVDYVWNDNRFVSIGLCPVWGNVDSTFTNNGLGLLLCRSSNSLSDGNQNNKQEIQPDDTIYIQELGNSFQVAMSRNVNLGYDCYLKSGHQYAIFYFDGVTFDNINSTPVSWFEEGYHHRGFSEVVGCELEIKLSEKIAPLFNWGLIYPGNGGTFEAIPKIKMEHILPDVTPIEFVSEISKLYNLVWQSNPHTKVAECEPFHYFYDWDGIRFPYYDWNDKAVIIKTEKDSLLSTNVYYKFVNDGSDRTLQKGMTENSILFGDVLFETNRNKDKEVKDVSLKFLSTCKMHWERNLAHNQVSGGVSRLAIWTPKIYSEDTYGFMRNHRKPDVNGSHEHKLLQYLGAKELGDHEITYNLVKTIDSGDPNNHYYINENEFVYGHAVSYESGSDTLPVTFSKSNTQTSEAQGGFFNRFHQSQIEMFKDRDELITALVYLSPSDVAQINYRRLVVIGNERYIISRIKDYNPANAEPTEVELVLVSDRGSKERLTH